MQVVHNIRMIHNIRGHTIVLSATAKRTNLTFRLVIVNYLTSVYVPSPPGSVRAMCGCGAMRVVSDW
jgi:hypothetical protein